MLESRWWVATVVGFLALGCADDDAEDDALVRGQVVRIEAATSYTGALALGADSVARVSLWWNPAPGGDAPSLLVVEEVYSPAPPLPFAFALRGTPPDPVNGDAYFLDVEIKQHAPAWTLGDLTNESVNKVEPPAHDVVLEVRGRESCDAPHADELCFPL